MLGYAIANPAYVDIKCTFGIFFTLRFKNHFSKTTALLTYALALQGKY